MLNSENRVQLSNDHFMKALEIITTKVGQRIEKHGAGAFTSKHEALGVFAEEYQELLEAVRHDDSLNPFIDEAIDLAVTAIVTVASVLASTPMPTAIPKMPVMATLSDRGEEKKVVDPYA